MLNNRHWAALAPQSATDAQSHEYMRVRGSSDVQSSDRKNKKRTQKRFAEQTHRQRAKTKLDGFPSSGRQPEGSGNFSTTSASIGGYDSSSLVMADAPQTYSTSPNTMSQWQQAMTEAGVGDYDYRYDPSGDKVPGPYTDHGGDSLMGNTGVWDGQGNSFSIADHYLDLFSPNLPQQGLEGLADQTLNEPLRSYSNPGMGLDYNSASSSMLVDARALGDAYGPTHNGVVGDFYLGGNATSSGQLPTAGVAASDNGATAEMVAALSYSGDMSLQPTAQQTEPQQPPGVPSASTTDSPPPQNRPSQDASLESRIAYILQQAALVGFENLDALAAEYYTANFCKTSALFSDQTLSRNRRLPKLIATIQQAAKEWSEWEHRGYQQEVVKSAEELLLAELAGFKSSPRFPEWMVLVSKENMEESLEDTLKVKQILQEEAPNLWALNTTLLGTGMIPHRNDQVRATLSTIKTLVGLVRKSE